MSSQANCYHTHNVSRTSGSRDATVHATESNSAFAALAISRAADHPRPGTKSTGSGYERPRTAFQGRGRGGRKHGTKPNSRRQQWGPRVGRPGCSCFDHPRQIPQEWNKVRHHAPLATNTTNQSTHLLALKSRTRHKGEARGVRRAGRSTIPCGKGGASAQFTDRHQVRYSAHSALK